MGVGGAEDVVSLEGDYPVRGVIPGHDHFADSDPQDFFFSIRGEGIGAFIDDRLKADLLRRRGWVRLLGPF
jgi:hypothetical protein